MIVCDCVCVCVCVCGWLVGWLVGWLGVWGVWVGVGVEMKLVNCILKLKCSLQTDPCGSMLQKEAGRDFEPVSMN